MLPRLVWDANFCVGFDGNRKLWKIVWAPSHCLSCMVSTFTLPCRSKLFNMLISTIWTIWTWQQLVTSIAKLSLYQSLLSHVSKFSVPLHMWLSMSGPALQQLRSPETGWSCNPWGTLSHLCPVNETRLKTRDTLRNYVPKREPRKEDLVKKHLESCNWVVEKVRTSAIPAWSCLPHFPSALLQCLEILSQLPL